MLSETYVYIYSVRIFLFNVTLICFISARVNNYNIEANQELLAIGEWLFSMYR
jgi:hypothetical protein